MDTVEATASLVRREDGWRIQMDFGNGIVAEQNEPPFPTRAEAQRALDLWIEENATSHLTAQ
jgi:hypothetical protein